MFWVLFFGLIFIVGGILFLGDMVDAFSKTPLQRNTEQKQQFNKEFFEKYPDRPPRP